MDEQMIKINERTIKWMDE